MGKNLLIVLTASLLITGCFKDDVHNGRDTAPTVGIYQGSVDSLANAPLNLTTADSIAFYMNVGLTSPYTLYKNITITAGIDDAARVAFNQTHTTQYEKLPDSLYKFVVDSAVLAAGARSTNIPLLIYSGKADLRRNYMLPVAITDAQGINISGTSGVIYLNQIGSPISGRYKVTGTRTNYIGKASAGVVETVVDLSTVATKVTNTTSYTSANINYSDLGISGWQYIVTYNPLNNAVTIAPNSVMLNAFTGVREDSFIIEAQEFDPVKRILHFKTRYTNEAGNEREVDEYLTAQ